MPLRNPQKYWVEMLELMNLGDPVQAEAGVKVVGAARSLRQTQATEVSSIDQQELLAY
jgi:hypothetical protein